MLLSAPESSPPSHPSRPTPALPFLFAGEPHWGLCDCDHLVPVHGGIEPAVQPQHCMHPQPLPPLAPPHLAGKAIDCESVGVYGLGGAGGSGTTGLMLSTEYDTPH